MAGLRLVASACPWTPLSDGLPLLRGLWSILWMHGSCICLAVCMSMCTAAVVIKCNSLNRFSLRLQVGQDLISLITTREGVDELLKLDDVIDLVIPRGSNALVSHIQHNTRIAVLGHADGICHIYVDPDSSVDMACCIIVDAKLDYPAACNAVEKVLVHSALARDGRVSTEPRAAFQRVAGCASCSGWACQALPACGAFVRRTAGCEQATAILKWCLR